MARLFDDAANEYLASTSYPVSDYPITLGCWFYHDDLSQAGFCCSIGDSGNDECLGGIQIQQSGGGNTVRAVSESSGLGIAASTTGCSLNTWHYATATFTSIAARAAFIDGGSKGTDVTNISSTPPVDSTTIGSWNGTYGGYFSGQICEVSVWNVILTDIEIHLLYRGVPPWLIRPRALVGFWIPLGIYNDRDYVQNNHLTAFNTPTWTNNAPARLIAFRDRAQFEPFASSRRRMSYGRYPGNLITRPWAYAPAAPVGGNPWYAYAQQ